MRGGYQKKRTHHNDAFSFLSRAFIVERLNDLVEDAHGVLLSRHEDAVILGCIILIRRVKYIYIQ